MECVLNFVLQKRGRTEEFQWQAHATLKEDDGTGVKAIKVLYVVNDTEQRKLISSDQSRWLVGFEPDEPVFVSHNMTFRIVNVRLLEPRPVIRKVLCFFLGEDNRRSLAWQARVWKDGITTLYVIDRSYKGTIDPHLPVWTCRVADFAISESEFFRIVPVVPEQVEKVTPVTLHLVERQDERHGRQWVSITERGGVKFTYVVDRGHCGRIAGPGKWTCVKDLQIFCSPNGRERICTVIPIQPNRNAVAEKSKSSSRLSMAS